MLFFVEQLAPAEPARPNKGSSPLRSHSPAAMAAALVQGASRGIGRAMVKELAASGRFSRVFAACRRPDEVADWADSAPQHVTVVPLRIDLDDDGSIEAASKEVEASGTPLSVLINAAGLLHDESRGIAPERKLEDLQLASLQRVFQVRRPAGPLVAPLQSRLDSALHVP